MARISPKRNNMSDQNALQNFRQNSSHSHHLSNYLDNMRNQTAIQICSETPLNSYLSNCLSSMSDQFALHICGDIPLTLTPPKHTTSPKYPRHSYLVAIKVTQSFANPSQHNLLLTLHATALHASQAPVHESQRSRRRPQEEFRRNCFLVFLSAVLSYKLSR